MKWMQLNHKLKSNNKMLALKISIFVGLIHILSVSASITRYSRSLSYDSVGLFKNALSILSKPHYPQSSNIYNHPKLLNHTISSEPDLAILQLVIGQRREDINLNITQLITKYGFNCEEHTVKTADDYILTMHRIPNNGTPVFLMHGLLCSSDDWITGGPENSYAYSLASEGYDVWMGNARGNKHSRNHLNLSPSDPEFWEFSWDEIGYFDLPAMIDYVLINTGHEQLYYVGHSQGTTAFYVMASLRPQYNEKIKLMVSLSAIAWMSHVVSPIVRLISPLNPFLDILLEFVGVNEFNLGSDLLKSLQMLICGQDVIAELLCSNVVFLFSGYDYGQLNFTNLPVVFGHFPSGASTKQIVHYGQEVVSGQFRKFDYGIMDNIQHYGHISPPSYPVEKITAPMAIFHSSGDWLSSELDLQTLIDKLSNIVYMHHIPLDDFNHMDYLWAKDMKQLIYEPMLLIMKKYK